MAGETLPTPGADKDTWGDELNTYLLALRQDATAALNQAADAIAKADAALAALSTNNGVLTSDPRLSDQREPLDGSVTDSKVATISLDKITDSATRVALSVDQRQKLIDLPIIDSFDDIPGIIPGSKLPPLAITVTHEAASQAAMLALVAEVGHVAIRTDTGDTYILAASPASTLANWKQINTPAAVTSVAGRTGAVALTKSDVGLTNVDNTSDVNKPVSTAAQTALNLKRDKTTATVFPVKWTGTAWEYTTLAAAQAAGLGANDVVIFIGNPGGSAPTWRRDHDIWTQA